MHVLLLSTDISLGDRASSSFARHLTLAQKVTRLTVFIFSSKKISITEHNLRVIAIPFRFFSLFTVLRYCNEHHVTLMSAQDPLRCGLFAYGISLLTRIPFEVQLHGDWFGDYYRNRSFFWKWLVRVAKFITRRATLVRAVSLRVARSLEMLGIPPSRYYIAPIAMNYDETETDVSSVFENLEGKQIILCVARLYPEKNVSLLMQALPYIRSYVPQAHVVIVGDGPLMHECKAIAKSLGCSGMVTFVGTVTHTHSYYMRADVVVIPSYSESFSRVALEATRAGVPVVMTDVGLAGDVIIDKESGRVIPDMDDGMLAEAIVAVLLHPQDAVSYVRAAREIVAARFSADPQEVSVHYWKTNFS